MALAEMKCGVVANWSAQRRNIITFFGPERSLLFENWKHGETSDEHEMMLQAPTWSWFFSVLLVLFLFFSLFFLTFYFSFFFFFFFPPKPDAECDDVPTYTDWTKDYPAELKDL